MNTECYALQIPLPTSMEHPQVNKEIIDVFLYGHLREPLYWSFDYADTILDYAIKRR